jgi:O-antigen/teichoic acid export membrane protein
MAIPLGIVMLLVSLSSSVPRYFIEHNLGLAQLGVFSAVSYLLAAGLTVLSALGHSVTPRLARSFENADWASFFRLLMLLLGFSSAMGLGGLLVAIAGGRTLLQKIYRPEYGDAHALLIWTMGVAWIAYVGSALGYAVTAARSFRGQPYACGAMLAATIAGCWVLIPSYQLVGAAASIGIGFLVQAVAWGLLLVKAVSSRRALA